MRMSVYRNWSVPGASFLACGLLFTASALAGSPESAGLEFFEKHVRPVFVEHCHQCHSAESEKVKGGLLVDSREALLKGGDSGPALVPGDPEKSLLIKAIRYNDENLQMPPKGKKLTDDQIKHLEEWVKIGAPDPRGVKAKIAEAPRASDHWAFKPIKMPAPPAVKNARWAQSPVDQFIVQKLESRGVTPNPIADKRTLIRRATYDLIGLPPTPQEVDQFIKDNSTEAFSKLVDRLLNSPHYGERWGRYWLDVARYADTKGYVFEEERRYPYSFTYRDYVIRSLNEDLPFDQFIVHQIAADLLPLGDDKRALAALGYLTLGRRFLNNQPDIIDDRIDVVTRGFMGLTVTCARCHDHKYDPIPTKDYYSLYGVFASSSEPNDKPLLGKGALPHEYPQYLAEREKRENELKKYREDQEAAVRAKLRGRVGDYLLAANEASRLSDKGKQDSLARERKLGPAVLERWMSSLKKWQAETNPIFAPWFAYAEVGETNFADKAKEMKWESGAVNPLVAAAFASAPESLKQVAERYTGIFTNIDQQWKELVAQAEKAKSTASGPNASLPTALPDKSAEELRQVLYAESSPLNLDDDEYRRLFDTPVSQKMRALRRKIDELDATHDGAPPKAMALVDNKTPQTPRVFIRGNANNRGPEVPRQFLEVLAGPDRKPFEKGSGRLELAQAIASPDNPLTARVIVNRVWMYHFGAPLVRTPSDFGLRSEPPSHPELLDYLAARFIQEGWSLKKLHRLIMLSRAYQQSSEHNAKAAKEDPANQLLWRMNRKRLDFESMRDTFLALGGSVDLAQGGRPVDLTTEPFTARRTVYGFVERQNLPGLFRTFDFASPDTTSPQRFATTVPQQALFLMNSPFVVKQAGNLINRPDVQRAPTPDDKLAQLHRICFQRAPDKDELALARQFIASQSTNEPAVESPAWQYGWGEFDEKAKRTKSFNALPHFNSYSWQGGKELPDPKLGWVLLNAEGGHPGDDQRHAAVRRWVAPRDGVITVSGELHHPEDKGDGVRARVVSNASGVAGEWTAHKSKTATPIEKLQVKRGDLIDFITDCRESVSHDSFSWSPKIKYVSSGGASSASPTASNERAEWDAKADFAGPAKSKPKSIDPWQKYAQVLLLANETMFVD
jgi:mono/diheme cytochrome c family protein